ncbi:uncharacterized protein [Littorina saxatilis]|uniref:uncharacterized protein isoform X2 n=1 Tax=Littorina saxatilis TaxID=31220 RepID=UPI0038B6326C
MEHAIPTAAGFKLAVEREQYTRNNGPLRVTEVLATTAGWLPCKKVMHAVGPRWSDYKDKALCRQHLVDTVYKCLRKAHSMQIASLGIPAIISGVDGEGNETCARVYLSALHTFDNAWGRETSLRHIHFVDTRGDIISVIQRTFAQNTSASTQEARTIQTDSDSDTASSANWNCNKMSSRSRMEDVSPDLETLLPRTSSNLLSRQTAQETPLHARQSPAGASLRQEPVKEDCCICRENMTNPKTLNCGHRFCTDCVDRWLSQKSRCPVCYKIQGILTGIQPQDGTMGMKLCGLDLQGFEGYGSLMIEYSFPEGKQNEEDPNQDRPYPAVSSKAYLPNTKGGRKVLTLLKIAFDRRLVFTFGYSLTSGEMGVIWNDIHHKTSRDSVHGYLDHNFLERMTLDLADNGVTEKDLTDIHKDFIENPHKYCQAPLRGSSQIHLSHTSGTSA